MLTTPGCLSTIVLMSTGIEIKSAAMFGTFCLHAPSRVLFDAGDGVANYLMHRIYLPSFVILSHFDSDHCLGLLSLIGLRAKSRGDSSKALTIIAPIGDHRGAVMRDYISSCWPRLPYELKWEFILPNATIKLSPTYTLRSFAMIHQHTNLTLGYVIEETRSRLKPELRAQIENGLIHGQPVAAYLKAARDRGEETQDTYRGKVFGYALDNAGFDYENVRDCQLLVNDCTFLVADDRQALEHATLEESVTRSRAVGVKRTVCAHISVRYSIDHQRESVGILNEGVDDLVLCSTDQVLSL